MTTGQAWQFRPYKWSEPKQLFHNGTLCLRFLPSTCRCRSDCTFPVKGFYVCWTNDPPNPKIKDWNVTELKVGQSSLCPPPRCRVCQLTLSPRRSILTGDTWTNRLWHNFGRFSMHG